MPPTAVTKVDPKKASPLALGLRPAGKRGRPSKEEQAARAKLARKTDETTAQRIDRISERFTIMMKLAQGSINGRVPSLIVSGAPGMGKSYNIKRKIDKAIEDGVIKGESFSGSITDINLFKTLYEYREQNSVILLDDCDGVYDSEDALNMLKAATDSTETERGRKISYLSNSADLKANDIPQKFYFRGSIIFITNKDLQAEVDFGPRSMAPHFAALMSRSHYLDLKLHDPDDCLAWVQHMSRKARILEKAPYGLKAEQQEQAIKWLEKHLDNVRELSIRTIRKIGDYMLTDPEDWESFARVTLLR